MGVESAWLWNIAATADPTAMMPLMRRDVVRQLSTPGTSSVLTNPPVPHSPTHGPVIPPLHPLSCLQLSYTLLHLHFPL